MRKSTSPYLYFVIAFHLNLCFILDETILNNFFDQKKIFLDSFLFYINIY